MVINLGGRGKATVRGHVDISPSTGANGSIMNITLKVLFINLCDMKFCGFPCSAFPSRKPMPWTISSTVE